MTKNKSLIFVRERLFHIKKKLIIDVFQYVPVGIDIDSSKVLLQQTMDVKRVTIIIRRY